MLELTPDPSIVRAEGPWVHRDVSANGIRLHVAECGEGPLVLFLHGFAEYWWAWHHQLPAMAEAGFRAVAVDLRGYGDSDKPPRGYDAWTLAGDVGGLIKALGARRAHLVGHAWGGMLAWTVAALHPRLVASVTSVGGAHPLALKSAVKRSALRPARGQARATGHLFRFQVPMAPEKWLVRDSAANVETLFSDWSGARWRDTREFAETVPAFRQAMLVPGVAHSALEYYRWAFRAQFRGDGRRFTEAVGRRVTAPLLQLHGAEDTCILPETALTSVHWAGPHQAPQIWPEVGHFPHLEVPERVTESLIDFVR
ncbi:pimeloyl-ACP methyl ester carboxylesterase [Amycolatopsis sulphurea]|uniref:Pimeloyl-ACP methyl ester carboxylesterase n=1 Tax=Amycolatopsis sulphurea TaxID=76022 RepID=A0A2A9FBN0_9PSEU|nr:pimeloyl-ACP methyl ester carboxylesterase [Amycolatopsis sulphurea]